MSIFTISNFRLWQATAGSLEKIRTKLHVKDFTGTKTKNPKKAILTAAYF